MTEGSKTEIVQVIANFEAKNLKRFFTKYNYKNNQSRKINLRILNEEIFYQKLSRLYTEYSQIPSYLSSHFFVTHCPF
jgi:hypothetical protein